MATLIANRLDEIEDFSNRIDIAAVSAQVRDPLPTEAIALLVETAQNTAGGTDVVDATLELLDVDSVANGGFVGTALQVDAAIRMGDGRDRLLGTVEVADSGNELVTLNGIGAFAPIVMGEDDDTVIGTANIARRNPGGEATVTGLRGNGTFALDLGAGDNTLIGQASIASNGEAGLAYGFQDMVVVSGLGSDSIAALATIVAPAADRQVATAYGNTSITGGGGEDAYTGFASTAFADQNVSFAGNGLRLVDRAGPTVVELEAEAEGGAETLAVGISGSLIETGNANDEIAIIASAGPAEALQGIGAAESALRTGAGDDTLSIVGQAVDAFGVTTAAGLALSVVEMGEGDDSLTLEADLLVNLGSVDAKGVAAFGSVIDMGGGDDTVLAEGALFSAGTDLSLADRQSVGLSLTSVDLGEGNDSLTASGGDRGIFDERDEDGVFLNVISGGGGNDVLDLQSGTGFVDGGEGVDTLLLEGSATDYRYRLDAQSNVLTMTDDVRTEIEATNIEVFGFAEQDDTFSASDLLLL